MWHTWPNSFEASQQPGSCYETFEKKKATYTAESTPAAANVTKDVKTRAEQRAGLLLTSSNVICGCKYPCTDSNKPRIRAEQNMEHIRMHHQPFRLKIYCPKLLGVNISNENCIHVGACVPKLSAGKYADVTFGNATYCGERLWMEPMDIIYDGITGAIGKSPIKFYEWYRRVTIFSLVTEQIRSVVLTGQASMNIQEWVVTSKACNAVRCLFMTGDPPCWDEGLCGQKAGEPPMVGPDITLARFCSRKAIDS
jgi:hypothetical protein